MAATPTGSVYAYVTMGGDQGLGWSNIHIGQILTASNGEATKVVDLGALNPGAASAPTVLVQWVESEVVTRALATPVYLPRQVPSAQITAVSWERMADAPATISSSPGITTVWSFARSSSTQCAAVVGSNSADGSATPSDVVTPSPSTNSLCSTSRDLTRAEGVGIGIGSAILGAFLAVAIGFLLIKRKPNATVGCENHISNRPSIQSSKPKEALVSTIAISINSAAAVIDASIPQPAEDHTIISEFRVLRSKIQGHIQTYYQTSGGDDDAAAALMVATLAERTPFPKDSLATMLAIPKTRPVVLRTALAQILTSRVLSNDEDGKYFLPTHLAETFFALRRTKLDNGTRSAFLSKWRTMTAALLGLRHEQAISAFNRSSDDCIRLAVTDADSFLSQYARQKATGQPRLANLEEIMKRGARVAWLLFAQPAEFSADWDNEVGRGTVVFPGLQQVCDEEGRALMAKRTLGDIKEVVRL